MKILFLGRPRDKIIEYLSSFGDSVISTEECVHAKSQCVNNVDFLVSYGYRHILKNDVLDLFKDRAINLHISYLPWNRGADPNLWSFLEDSPKGVSIHFLDSGIDTGNLIVRRKVDYSLMDTLRTSYERLSNTIEELFMETWPTIRIGKSNCEPQSGEGSYHRSHEKDEYLHLLTHGWDTPVNQIIGKALIHD